MGINNYILDDDGNIVFETNFARWAQWYSGSNKHIKKTSIGKYLVSTVFLGIDHNFDDNGPPILFETMVFGHNNDEYQERSCTKEESLIQHDKAIKFVIRVLRKENNIPDSVIDEDIVFSHTFGSND